jgi:hypothetical protein
LARRVADSFRRLTEKIVRGIVYIEDKKIIEPPYAVEECDLPSR